VAANIQIKADRWFDNMAFNEKQRKSASFPPATATNTGMGDRVRAGDPAQYFTKPFRPTQPPTLCGIGNGYQPKCGDALRLWIKGR